MAEEKRRSLGRGLSALLGDTTSTAISGGGLSGAGLAAADSGLAAADGQGSGKGLRTMPVEQLQPGKFQPRHKFDEERIADLVESVREKGILQPILVRPVGDEGRFEIIAGERRWRAAQRAQLHEVPVLVREMSDSEALEVALVENLQRQDLSPLEEAEGYRRLMEEFSHTQELLAKAVGKSRSHVANMMRLLALPDAVKDMVERGKLTAGHARALLTAEDPVELAKQVAAKQLNVRQTEKLVQNVSKPKTAALQQKLFVQDTDTAALERDLTSMLGVKVSIRSHGKGGELVIHYGSLEQLDDILSRLTGAARGGDLD